MKRKNKSWEKSFFQNKHRWKKMFFFFKHQPHNPHFKDILSLLFLFWTNVTVWLTNCDKLWIFTLKTDGFEKKNILTLVFFQQCFLKKKTCFFQKKQNMFFFKKTLYTANREAPNRKCSTIHLPQTRPTCRSYTCYSQGLLYHRTCKRDFLCSWPSLNSYLK